MVSAACRLVVAPSVTLSAISGMNLGAVGVSGKSVGVNSRSGWFVR